ncbi:MAG TPA: DUF3857 domain-containing protein [Thermoanaerobaculia bacterium]
MILRIAPRRGVTLSLLFLVAFALQAAPGEQTAVPPLAEREIALGKAAPFTLSSSELLGWAESVRARHDDDVVVLLDEMKVVFDDAGRSSSSRRMVYTTRTQAAADRWAAIATYWSPWHQERPEMTARVVTADGVEHRFDPKTIDDAPAADSSRTVYSDGRHLRAPLPAVGPASVVEQMITVRETQPVFDRGTAAVHFVSRRVPVRITRLDVEAPAGTPLKFVPRHVDVEPIRTTDGARARVLYEMGPFAADEESEAGVPGDVVQTARIQFSTGESWQAIASRYHQIVEEQIAAADLKKIVRETVGKEKDAARILEKIVERLHRDVRYTGIELAEASIVPRKPAETLGRRFGDCKDKAALLVAMLREAGIPAFVALLRTGPGADVDPQLPGFGLFDHAIVHVPAPVNRWIDATDDMGNIATLPSVSQNRLALIAAPGTTELVKTPAASAPDNRVVKSVEVRLSEFGKATLVETTTYSGSPERRFRHSYDGAEPKATRKVLEEYVKDRYLSEALTDFSYTEPRDRSKPFELRLEIAESGRGVATLQEAAVGILPAGLLDRVSEILTTGASKKRRHDYLFDEPVLVEWNYRIVAPPGFRARPLPDKEIIPIGTGSVTKEFRKESDQVIVAKLTLDTGKTRLTPTELEDFRQAAVKYKAAEAIILGFDQVGHAHLLNGEVREALAEFRRLAALHPHEALHRGQTGLALMAGGLGEAARKEAEAAIALDPASVAAYQLRGWIYQHDLLGRHLKKGFDLDTALASYRKAKELAPKDATIRGNIAVLLEHDPSGTRYGSKAKLAEAVAEYEALHADLGEDAYQNNVAVALFRAGEFAKLKKFVEQNPSFPNRRELLLMAEIALEGTEAIPRITSKIVSDPAQRNASLLSVGEAFLQIRRYPAAVACLLEAAKGSTDAADLRSRADAFRNVRPVEELTFPERDPASVVKRMFIATRAPDSSYDTIAPLLANEVAKEYRDAGARERLDDLLTLIRNQSASADPALALDLSLGTMQIALAGNDAVGYRAIVRALGANDSVEESYFVVKEDGQYRIATPVWMVLGHGIQARNALEANDPGRARRWLDWAREEMAERVGEDPVAGHAFLHFWKQGQEAEPEAMRDAIAVLLSEGSKETATKAIARFLNSSSDEQRLKYDIALANAYAMLEDGPRLEIVAGRLLSAVPDSEGAFLLHVTSLGLQKKYDGIREAASRRLARDANNENVLRVLADAMAARGDYEECIRIYQQVIDGGQATALDYNNIAWYSLWKQPIAQAAVDAAQQAVRLTSSRDPFSLHTLATLYAEQGKTSEAKAAIWQAMEAAGSGEPQADDHYVLGRIAEEFGILDAAAAAYRKVEKDPDRNALSTWDLAQKRLSAMAKK